MKIQLWRWSIDRRRLASLIVAAGAAYVALFVGLQLNAVDLGWRLRAPAQVGTALLAIGALIPVALFLFARRGEVAARADWLWASLALGVIAVAEGLEVRDSALDPSSGDGIFDIAPWALAALALYFSTRKTAGHSHARRWAQMAFAAQAVDMALDLLGLSDIALPGVNSAIVAQISDIAEIIAAAFYVATVLVVFLRPIARVVPVTAARPPRTPGLVDTPSLSIVVPTLNEVGNIDRLLDRLLALPIDPRKLEILVADDGSRDGTLERVGARAAQGAPVRLVARAGKPDLAQSVRAAALTARGEVIVVMDADLSHPPERVLALVAPIAQRSADLAVGSRQVPGGGAEAWPWRRRLLSRLGQLLAWPICDIRDLTSGFFAARRQAFAALPESIGGYKVLLEIAMAGGDKLRVQEVPITFTDRVAGQSKLSFATQLLFLKRLIELAGGRVSMGTAWRFGVVGLLGVAVDAAGFFLLSTLTGSLAAAHLGSFAIASLTNFTLNRVWAFRDREEPAPASVARYLRFVIVALAAVALRGGILALVVEVFALPRGIGIFAAIGATALINYLGAAFYVFPRHGQRPPAFLSWRVASVGIVLYLVVLRICYAGVLQLQPDEAYYWNYAQHLDFGYLDHPPMVAWLITLGTALLGNHEWGVRIGAVLSWSAAAIFIYRLTDSLHGKTVALRALLLAAVLPFFFAQGLFMMPDAPLLACWAAALYYAKLALIDARKGAWWGLGAAMGLGLLSKYTMALAGLPILTFMLVDAQARRWWRRPEPYSAAALALALFSPVLVWNARHDWASFIFQTTRRLDFSHSFGIGVFGADLLVLLTPAGILALILIALGRLAPDAPARRTNLLLALCGLLPLTIFALYSVQHPPRLVWLGPIALAALPVLGLTMATRAQGPWRAVRALWPATILVLILGYGAVLHYATIGIPGISAFERLRHMQGWKEIAAEISLVEQNLARASGQQPLVVGMDKQGLASELAFHTAGTAPMDVTAPGLLCRKALMYAFWSDYPQHMSRPILLVALNAKDLDGPDIERMLIGAQEIRQRIVTLRDHSSRRIFYRIAEGYDDASGTCTPPAVRRLQLHPLNRSDD